MLLLQPWMVFFGEIPVFLQLSQVGLFGRKWAFSTLQTANCRNYSSENAIQLSKGNIVLDARASTMHTFLLEVHGLPLLSWIVLRNQTQPISSCKHHEEFLSKPNTGLTGKHVLLTWTDSFERYMCFFNSGEQAYLKWGEPPTLNIGICRVHCLKKLNEFS